MAQIAASSAASGESKAAQSFEGLDCVLDKLAPIVRRLDDDLYRHCLPLCATLLALADKLSMEGFEERRHAAVTDLVAAQVERLQRGQLAEGRR